MPIVQEFVYHKPGTLEEALELLSKYQASARILAGGTDLVNLLKEDQLAVQAIIDIKGLEALRKLEFYNNALHIGALVTFTDFIESPIIQQYFPLILETAQSFASVGIRNRATMVGNICSAVPSLDSAPVLLLYDAEVIVRSKAGTRTIPIQKWFVAPKKTALAADEMVTAITISLPKSKHAGCYLKLGRYRGEDLAQAGTGILVFDNQQYRIAFCAVGPVPTRAQRIEALLNGKPLTDELLQQVKDRVEAEIAPLTDIRASQEYRTHIIKVMLERGLKAAVAGLNGDKHANLLGG
jgi:CO/xanthine dehydrogenase FAD-binding subunit